MTKVHANDFGLQRMSEAIYQYQEPAIGFALINIKHLIGTVSRFGGQPMLPKAFQWPTRKDRPLDFLMQLNLAHVVHLDLKGRLPSNGMLSFFYDLDEQPWGYDPANLDGYSVLYSAETELIEYEIPNSEFELTAKDIEFSVIETLPCPGSAAMDELYDRVAFTDAEWDNYLEFIAAYQHSQDRQQTALHRMFGHSSNIQGDMQLEAQLVTSGFYCGDQSGYKDSRAQVLYESIKEWVLLLQIDTDDSAEVMWGDSGRLYFWIRQQDLASQKFDRIWMTMQCY